MISYDNYYSRCYRHSCKLKHLMMKISNRNFDGNGRQKKTAIIYIAELKNCTSGAGTYGANDLVLQSRMYN
jgi:hypothetical protein